MITACILTIALFALNEGPWEARELNEDQRVSTIAVHPDGQSFAAVVSNRIKIWTVTGSVTLPDVDNDIYSIEYSPDGRNLACAVMGGHIHVYDTRTAKRIKSVDLKNAGIGAFTILSDNRMIVSTFGSKPSELVLLNQEGAVERKFSCDPQTVIHRVALMEQSGILITGHSDGKVCLWDMPTGKVTKILEGHEKDIRGLAVSYDEKTIATGDSSGSVRLWKTDGTELGKKTRFPIHDLSLSPDGKLLAIATAQQRSRADVRRLPRTMSTHDIMFEGTVDVCSTKDLNTLQADEHAAHGLAFSKDGSSLIVGGKLRIIHIQGK